MIGALLSFSAMAISVRELSPSMGAFEIQFFRTLMGFVILIPLMIRHPEALFNTARMDVHFLRNSVHFAATFAWTLGITLLPLAQVFALEFTTPIWTTLLAILFLSERLTLPRTIAVIGGFIGILVIVRPGVAVFNPASLLVLGAAIGYAINIVATKFLTRTSSALTIVFYMSLMQLPMTFISAMFYWTTPGWPDLPWIILIGMSGLGAHYSLARALNLADATVTMPIDFARLPLIAIVGYLFYSEGFDMYVLIGGAIIVAVNYNAVRKESAIRHKT